MSTNPDWSVAAFASTAVLHETTSLCRQCKHALPARVVELDGEVWMAKNCPDHGPATVRLSTNVAWYNETRAVVPRLVPPPRAPKPVAQGCPFDCGACAAHQSKIRLPVVTITSACNLDCPICYVHNKNDGAYNMTKEDFAGVLDQLVDQQRELDIINITGGEPLMHPDILEFIQMAHDRGIHRVSVCSNGLKLVKNEALVQRLGELGARIALSFDSFEAEADYLLQGAHLVKVKQQVLDLLDKYNVDCTLIPVMTKGVNDHEIGKIIAHALRRRSVRHLEVHTITYTGQGGVSFDRSGRISMYEVLEQIGKTTDGLLSAADFVPSPHAHPLCYQIAYLLCNPDDPDERPIPITQLITRDEFYAALSERLYLEPSPQLETALHDAINRVFAADDDEPDRDRKLRFLKRMLAELFPQDRVLTPAQALRVSERWAKAIYLHSHMDEDTFDIERAVQCCDSNCYADGSTIPVCNYNVLYRETEEHFMMKPVPRTVKTGGRLLPVVRR